LGLSDAAAAGPAGGYGWPRYYVLALLTVTYALSIVDRFLLGILLPQIKEELVLNDSMLGPCERHRIRALLCNARCTDCGYRRRHSVHSGNPNVACGHSEGRELPLICEPCSSHIAEQLGRAHFQWFGCTQQVRLKLSILSKPFRLSWLLSGDLTH
jgi:hypothetical protein